MDSGQWQLLMQNEMGWRKLMEEENANLIEINRAFFNQIDDLQRRLGQALCEIERLKEEINE